MNWNFSNKSPLVEQATFIHTALLSAMTPVGARLDGKYRWREFPVVITGNYRPGKYSKFWQSGKYWEI